jgi:glycosyltransferase involved in cell wall biosynthesis
VNIVHSPELFNRQADPSVRVGEALASAPSVIHIHQVDHPELVDFLRAYAPVLISAHAYTACPSGHYYFQPGQPCTRAHGPMCVPNMLFGGCTHRRDPRGLRTKYERAGRGLQALRRADLAIAYSSSVDRHLAVNGVTRRVIVPLFSTLPIVRSTQTAGTEASDAQTGGAKTSTTRISTAQTGPARASSRRVLFAGRIVRPKGAHILVRAAREVDAELVICGEGRRLADLRQLARDLGIAQRVDFRGWLTAEELADELALASIIAIPSLWPEPLGLVGIEAFAAGRPVVASATGGVTDWLQHGVNGLLVAPGDVAALGRALNELLDDPRRRQTMGAAGRELVESRFSRERHVAALLDAYRTVLRS